MSLLDKIKSLDPSTTAFLVGAAIVNAKLLCSGITIAGIVLSQFGGGDYAAAMGALGAIYVARQHSVAVTSQGTP
jgi:hypothetical protein